MAKPVGYRLTVKPDDLEDFDPVFAAAKKAGIDIPKQHKDREESIVDTGTVLEIGSDCWAEFKEPWCKVGDKVAYAKYAGKAIKQKDGSKLLVLNDEDVCAVLGETDE